MTPRGRIAGAPPEGTRVHSVLGQKGPIGRLKDTSHSPSECGTPGFEHTESPHKAAAAFWGDSLGASVTAWRLCRLVLYIDRTWCRLLSCTKTVLTSVCSVWCSVLTRVCWCSLASTRFYQRCCGDATYKLHIAYHNFCQVCAR